MMREELGQLENIINMMEKRLSSLRGQAEAEKREFAATVLEVNGSLFFARQIEGYEVDASCQDEDVFFSQAKKWIGFMRQELECRRKQRTKVDYDFYDLVQKVRYTGREELKEYILQFIKDIRQRDERTYCIIRDFHEAFWYFWGRIDLDAQDYGMIEDRVGQLKDHLEDFRILYDRLGDYRSKKVLYGILRFWMTFDYDYKRTIKEANFDDYFDYDLIECGPQEVFVDLGAWTGDSALSFIHNYGEYKKIYCYDIMEDSLEKLKEQLSPYDNIVVRNVGVGKEASVMYVEDTMGKGSTNRVTDGEPGQKGKREVQLVTLDDDIKEPVTFIKMDIEGSELDAIEGAVRHIREEKPKLAICTYHNNHHIWEIPKRLMELNPDYRFYMRYNGNISGVAASEYVLFAL